VALIGGVAYLVIGGWLLLREWKAYKFGLENIDDPETWTEETEALSDEEGEGL